MPNLVPVPDVSGLTRAAAETALTTAGLAVGATVTANNPTVAAGRVIGTTPKAGMLIDPGSTVSLQISSGPPAQVGVPDVTGLTLTAAETILRDVGLVLGTVSAAESNVVPANGVSNTIPPAGSLVDQASKINLEISSGPKINWYAILPTAGVFGIVLLILAVVIFGLYKEGFIEGISQEKTARGLITFLIAVVTVGIALILVISNILSSGEDAEKRFDRGKQILTTMIGVLGTIVGFYFGASTSTQTPQQGSGHQISVTNSLPDGSVGKAYPPTTIQVTGGVPPLKWSLAPAPPAGLSLDSASGAISGTPTTASPKTKYMATIIDSATPPNSSTVEITLEIKP